MMQHKVNRFYTISMRNDVPQDSFWIVRDRRQLIDDQIFKSPYRAQTYCKIWNDWADLGNELEAM